MNLTKNFTLNELTYSDTARTLGIKNIPAQAAINNLKALCTKVLQPLRDGLGVPIIITSGYRCPMLNKKVGGASNSQHQYGQAADICAKGKSLPAVFNYIKNFLPFDQLLFEKSKTAQWVHVSYRADGKNRKLAIDNYKL